MTHHLGQPIRIDYFDIIIDQANNGPLGVTNTKVVDGRVVKGGVIAQYLNPAVFLLDLGKEIKSLLLNAAIIENQDLEMGIGTAIDNAAHCSFSQSATISSRNEQTDQRSWLRNRITHPIGIRSQTCLNRNVRLLFRKIVA